VSPFTYNYNPKPQKKEKKMRYNLYEDSSYFPKPVVIVPQAKTPVIPASHKARKAFRDTFRALGLPQDLNLNRVFTFNVVVQEGRPVAILRVNKPLQKVTLNALRGRDNQVHFYLVGKGTHGVKLIEVDQNFVKNLVS
jgi:hypothetical protein